MKIEPSELIAEMLLRHIADQDQILWTIKDKYSEADFLEARQLIGQIMGAICSDGLYPIFKAYPDLRPADYI